MLPPPASRKSSHAYLPVHHGTPSRTLGHGHAHGTGTRQPSFRAAAESVLGLEDERFSTAVENEDRGDDDDSERFREDEVNEQESGLEETLEKIGFGAYQWRLLALCGFGWMSDNSALQCIAVILPRVQVHYDLSSKVVGLLSASTMAGMMVGAVAWGVVSDLLGRALPFNATLFLTAVFGIAASFSPNFGVLCGWMFCLGSAVGGSMPTDGTLFLENLPHSKQYLLTLLSVFFSLGAVLSSVVSLVFLPGHSCRHDEPCDVASGENDGWRRVLLVLGMFNLACAFARWFLFRLQESPRYLVSNGREQEAIVALQAIATFNDHSFDIQRADVQATEPGSTVAASDSTIPHKASSTEGGERSPIPQTLWSAEGEGAEPTSGDSRYGGIGVGPPRTPFRNPIRTGSAFYTPGTPGIIEDDEGTNSFERSFGEAHTHTPNYGRDEEEAEAEGLIGAAEGKREKRDKIRNRGDGSEVAGEWKEKPGEWWESWKRQMGRLFVPQWRRTVVLMWIIWGSMSLAYTMFNVWLPTVLESKATGQGDEAIKEALRDFVLYSLAGCPGSIIGAWMIQTSLGRRKSLAIWTLATGLSTFTFIAVQAKWAVVTSSMVIAMAATAMYAVLYGMTPETFGTSIRGTACGTSAALSRFTGILAPVSAGILLSISPSLPLIASAGIFVCTAACSLALPVESGSGGRRKGRGGWGLMH